MGFNEQISYPNKTINWPPAQFIKLTDSTLTSIYFVLLKYIYRCSQLCINTVSIIQ